MPLAYYSVAAREAFWTEHWGGHSVEELLAVARRSPLTTLITQALPAQGGILEAGCGLGQYVLLLRERGWRVAGVDWSLEALSACRRVAAAPLAAMELRTLAVRDRSLAWIRRRNLVLARRGGDFYQYAFARTELLETLTRLGFVVRSVHPYDPARLLRQALRRVLPSRSRPEGGGLSSGASVVPSEHARSAPARDGPRRRPLTELGRRLLYTDAALRLLGHMLLVVARKA